MSFADKWLSRSTPKDNKDNKDKRGEIISQQGAFAPSVPFVSKDKNYITLTSHENEPPIQPGPESQENQSPDPFRDSGEAVKVYLPPLDADVWFCADKEAMTRVKHEELACFLYNDLVYIHQGKPGAERLSRLHEVYAMRHPVTVEVLTLFGGKIKSIKAKGGF